MSAPVPTHEPDPLIDFTWLADALWRGKFLILGITSFLAGTAICLSLFVLSPSYTASAQLLIAPQKPRILDLNATQIEPRSEQRHLATEMSILQSALLLRQVVVELSLQNDAEFNPSLKTFRPIRFVKRRLRLITDNRSGLSAKDQTEQLVAETAAQLAKAIVVERRENSGVTTVSAISEDAKRAQEIANTLSRLYLQMRSLERAQNTAQTRTWLAAQLDDLGADLTQSENAYELAAAEAALVSENALEVKTMQLRQIRADMAKIKVSDTKLAGVNDEASLTLAQLTREEADLEKTISVQSSALLNMKQKEREMRASQAIYQQFLNRYHEVSVQQGMEFDRVKLLSEATVPMSPSRPRGTRIIGFSLMLGFAIGLALACLRKRLEDHPPT